MKTKLILISLVALLGCEMPVINETQPAQRGIIQVLDVDSCQYVVWDWIDAGAIVHKQNCKYCLIRNKK